MLMALRSLGAGRRPPRQKLPKRLRRTTNLVQAASGHGGLYHGADGFRSLHASCGGPSLDLFNKSRSKAHSQHGVTPRSRAASLFW